MPSGQLFKLLFSATVWGVLAGCAASIPAPLAGQVSWNLGFPEVRRQPEAYRGRVVALGGIVTHIDAVERGYRVIVSELPLDGSGRHRPAVDQLPRGRFAVLLPRHALPTGLEPGVEITVVGEILGKTAVPSAGEAEEVALLEERYTRVWGPSWWPRCMIGIWGGISL
ncbi:MAG TPA: Slp family lipoprotein [Candidatus Tectomicrobia bacterium]|nr:Slp family lipoprotein [Candidatus Tectomicrobia bacterium]